MLRNSPTTHPPQGNLSMTDSGASQRLAQTFTQAEALTFGPPKGARRQGVTTIAVRHAH
jgi:hypothetical protein